MGSWTLVDEDWQLVANKAGATRLGFALLLKFFELEARFPTGVEELPSAAVSHIADQVKVDRDELTGYAWEGRSIKYHRAQIRDAFGFREFTVGRRITSSAMACRTPRATLVVLTATALLLMSTWFSATAVIPQVRAEWQLSAEAVAWLTIAVQWGFVTGALFSAAFTVADTIAPTRLIFLCSLGAAGTNLLLLAMQGVGLGVTARFGTGFFIAGVYPPALKLISTWYRHGRGAALGLLVGALSVSQGVPHLVNGLGGLDWRLVIVTTSALTVVGGVITLTVVAEGPFPFPAAVFDPRQIRAVLRDRGTRLAVIGYLCHMWELYAAWAWFLVFFTAALHRRGLDDPVLAAYVTFAVFAVGGLANWSGGALGDRIGRERTAIAMMAVSGTCAATIGLLMTAPLWLLIGVSLVWGYSVVGDSTQFSTLVTELADQSYVGTALTLQMALGFLLTGATIWLVPAVEQAVGWHLALAVLAVGPFAGIVAMRRLLVARAAPRPVRAGAMGVRS